MGKKEKKAKKNFNKKEIYQALFDIFDLNPGMVFTYKQLAQRLNIKGGDQQLLVAVLREMKSKQDIRHGNHRPHGERHRIPDIRRMRGRRVHPPSRLKARTERRQSAGASLRPQPPQTAGRRSGRDS